ncbi:hypothetical protein OH491_03650 [Termitidicoccus mucosus]|uniref:Glycosyl hydrolase family 32 n=1 Tax=Termitidicoccus mucosus TaxID=1184151 RepID=A0A178IP22_9BACT|nr:hypothetical protein AW736_05955 [Opitutaceae bacterium TSB47]
MKTHTLHSLLFCILHFTFLISHAAALPALMKSTDHLPAKLAMFSKEKDAAAARFYFDDRKYGGHRDPYPEWLEGLLYFESAAECQRNYQCLRAGDVIALAPVNKARDFTEHMVALGFVQRPEKTFFLFRSIDGQYKQSDIYGAFGKTLADGEKLQLPGWVILAGFDVPRQTPSGAGELLYNGIRLPGQWPPRINLDTDEPPPVPWLEKRPAVVPIDLGRQLFVDDFLVEQTNLAREFHYPEKYSGNPVLVPETPLEHGRRNGKAFTQFACATPKSGGLWWSPEKQVFELWYEAGWIGTVAYATSRDGLKWERPSLPLRPGTNQVIPDKIKADSWTVVRDPHTSDPQKRFKLFLNGPGDHNRFHCVYATSPDGITWSTPLSGGISGDRSGMFYNPFRKKWVGSLRLTRDERRDGGRSRAYWEGDDFEQTMNWLPNQPVPWARADKLDLHPVANEKTQLYNLDAVAYESLMLGFFQIHYGPKNSVCAKAGIPKFTGLNFAYSRDGFHWHRPDRAIAINSAHAAGTWDRGYVQSLGNICVIRGDKLWFYYIGFAGNEKLKMGENGINDIGPSGMHAGGATGIATLRRDGFVSMNASAGGGVLLTRQVRFSGARLFVNAIAGTGGVKAELCEPNGRPIGSFTLDNCIPFTGDSTLTEIRWKDAADLSALAEKTVRIRFQLGAGAKLFSFWVSRDETGRSDGYLAGGGPGYTSLTDTVGRAALDVSVVKK